MNTGAMRLITAARGTQEWLRDRPRVFDVTFAALAALMALGELSSESSIGPREPDTLGVTVLLVGAFALIWRRSAPIAVLYFVGAASCVFYILNYGAFMAFIGMAALYAVAVHEQNRRMAWTAIGIVSTVLIVLATFTVLDGPNGFSLPDVSGMAISIGGVIVAGAVIRNKDEIFADTKERAERAEADRKAEAEHAVTRERLRIAREMHDVVAHGMSLITVQAAAAREIALTRPEDAARLMHSVETTGRDSLAEMRRMLGVLRNDAADPRTERGDLAPQPTLADLDSIITHCIEAGTPTDLVIGGDPRPLSPGIELAAFRIVQEALTNVVKHGGDAATASVELRYKADQLEIAIHDTGRGVISQVTGSGGGHGLVGMRERVEIYNGRLAAGPRPGGGYQVAVSLPIKAAPPRSSMTATEPERAASA